MKEIVFDIETTGLNPLNSRITCICAKVIGGDAFYSYKNNEKELILDFIEWLKKEKVSKLISTNGRDFDLPFIFMRSFTWGFEYKDISFLKWDIKHFDLINDITNRKISLNNLARLYGFELKNGNGLKAIKLFQENRLIELKDYCMYDVLLTEKIYLKYLEIKNDKR